MRRGMMTGRLAAPGMFAALAVVAAGCPVDNSTDYWTDYDQTFTVTSDVALSGTFETVEWEIWGIYESYPKGAYFFSTASEFEVFYTTLTGNSTPPSIDFMQYRVVAVVDTEQPDTLYGVKIISVELDSGDQYNVTAHFSEADGMGFTVVTKPYHIVRVEIQ